MLLFDVLVQVLFDARYGTWMLDLLNDNNQNLSVTAQKKKNRITDVKLRHKIQTIEVVV